MDNMKRTPGSYGFYTRKSDSSQIDVSKERPSAPTIAPGTGEVSGSMSKRTTMRKVIKTTGGF